MKMKVGFNGGSPAGARKPRSNFLHDAPATPS
jgi:hypothetical protein